MDGKEPEHGGQGAKPKPTQPQGIPRNALLSSSSRPSVQHRPSPPAGPQSEGPAETPASVKGDTISVRAFERFKRASTFAPRTAFLGSPAIGPRRHHAAPTQRAVAPPSADPLRGSLDLDPAEPLLTEEEINAFFNLPLPATDDSIPTEADLDAIPGAEPEISDGAPTTRAEPQRPAWLKNQVADLADLVQALDLQARAHHAHVGLEEELSRLRQFTRTMGFVASPPPKGRQEFDVATLVEEALGAIAGTTPNAPRILFRKRGNRTETTADKVLVAAAIDALLQTAVACAGSGDVVRITVEGRVGEPIVTEIEFPPGPIGELHPDRILTPYALRKILPNIGPNALAAAAAIAVGQGGDMSLARNEDGTATFLFELLGRDQS